MSAPAHLLIVDDDKELCALLSKFLAQQGYRVSVAHNGNAMSLILEASRINLVILDLMSPGEDGLAMPAPARHQHVTDHHADGDG
jgi:two-component system OmpR family response regulator